MPPIVGAAERADKAAVEMLLRHGADLFRPATTTPLPRNALTAAQAANADAKFQVWLGQQWQDGAKRSRRFDWAASIEQDGRQTPVSDKPVTLARKPFTIVVRARPDVRVIVSASSELGLFEDYKSEYTPGTLTPVGPIHSQASVAADVCDGAERTLFLRSRSKDPAPRGYGIMAWQQTADCPAFTSTAPDADGEVRYQRLIGTLMGPDGETSVAASTVGSLYLVMGTELPVVFPQFEYYGVKQCEVRFR